MIPDSATTEQLRECYDAAVECIRQLCRKLDVANTPLPTQPKIVLGNQYSSNVGQDGYETYVRTLKEWILEGQIFQAVPSQRVTRPTSLHPFNVYLTLRTVNPSPYTAENFSKRKEGVCMLEQLVDGDMRKTTWIPVRD